MFKRLKQIYKKEQFRPSLLSIFLNPFYFARKELYKKVKQNAQYINGITLDIGCGQKPYASLFHSKTYIGLEIDTPENRLKKQADYFYDGHQMPFKDNSFDSIVCNEVLEHVFNPKEFLEEIHRVMKGGGTYVNYPTLCMG